jgi:hypothetical protein
MEGKLRAFFTESKNGEEDNDENGQNKVKLLIYFLKYEKISYRILSIIKLG